MAIIDRDDLKLMVNRLVPRTYKEEKVAADKASQDMKTTLRQQAAENMRKLGR